MSESKNAKISRNQKAFLKAMKEKFSEAPESLSKVFSERVTDPATNPKDIHITLISGHP